MELKSVMCDALSFLYIMLNSGKDLKHGSFRSTEISRSLGQAGEKAMKLERFEHCHRKEFLVSF